MLYILLIFIFIRPFISSLAYPHENSIYSTLLFCLLFIWAIYKKRVIIEEFKKIKYPIILFLISLISSVIISSDKINSLSEIYKYITGLLIFFIAASLSIKNRVKVLHTIILSGIIISVLAIYQYFFGFNHLIKYIENKNAVSPFVIDYVKQKRVFYPFVTPNILAGFLILVIPIVFIIKGKIRWIILSLLLSALFFTKSLGAILSLFLGVLLFSKFYINRGSFSKFQSKLYFAVLISLGILSVIFVFVLRQLTAKGQFLPFFSITQRIKYWQDTLTIIKFHPILGAGLGNFNLFNSRYAHNLYLQIWAEMGILGLISFLWIGGIFFKNAFKNIQNNPLVISLTIAYSIFLIHNFIDFTFFLPEVSFILWMIIGCLFFVFACDNHL